jgi:pSer/pThr/pTyr-binding forkhead associated (FHA) protein
MTGAQSTNFAVKFISGKYKGGQFYLAPEHEYIIGRAAELDIVLVEDMVSRKHARITTHGGQIVIEDLGSTNGTFVNGEKIRRSLIAEGDRVLVGTSILKLVGVSTGPQNQAASQMAAPMASPVPTPMATVAQMPAIDQDGNIHPGSNGQPQQLIASNEVDDMSSGDIADMPLAELLQIYQTAQRTGVLTLRGERKGTVVVDKGKPTYATISDLKDLDSHKAILRMLSWHDGTFELEASDLSDYPNTLKENIDIYVRDFKQHTQSMTELSADLPEMEAMLAPQLPLIAPLRNISPDMLDVFQLIHNFGHVETILNKSTKSDVDTFRALIYLTKEAYVRAD